MLKRWSAIPLSKSLLLLVVTLLFSSGCGYQNVNSYSGTPKVIYLKDWKNRTNEFGLNSEIYTSLHSWFENSKGITVVPVKEKADYILTGELQSIQLPGLSYDASNDVKEVKLRLSLRYVLQQISTGQIILEQPNQTFTQNYLVGKSSIETSDNRDAALQIIINDLSQRIYQRTLMALKN